MQRQSTFLLTFTHLFGVISVCAGLLAVLAVASAYLLGVDRSPLWLYQYVWPYAAQILLGAPLCTVSGSALLVYVMQRDIVLKGNNYELWRG